jgi:hypothetical protein
MNFYIKIFILFLIIYILFLHRDNKEKKVKKNKNIENMDIYNYADQYRLNNYDINDLNLERSKRTYPINYEPRLDKKNIKYLKAVNVSLEELMREINKDDEILYNTNNQLVYKLEKTKDQFNFIILHLAKRLNEMSRNLYEIKFNKIVEVNGEQTSEQSKVEMKLNFSIKARKEGLSDKNKTYDFDVKILFILNKLGLDKTKMDGVFIRNLFVDDIVVNDYMPHNSYDW